MTKQSRGWQGTVLKAMRAPDFELTVTGRTQVTPHFLRLSFSGGGLLNDREPHPTMWIRLWFPNRKGLQQRAYTLANPDSATDTFDLEFAVHDGPAPNWAGEAKIGDTITATLMGSKFAVPDPAPAGWVIVGDTASLPAINSLLASIGDTPARVWLEWQHEDDQEIPVAATSNTQVNWVERKDKGRALVEQVEQASFDAADHFGWVACDMKSTRAIVGILRNQYNLDKKSIKSQAYWVQDRPFS